MQRYAKQIEFNSGSAKCLTERYETLNEFLAVLDTRERAKEYSRDRDDSHRLEVYDDPEFRGVKGYSEAKTLMERGVPRAIKELKTAISSANGTRAKAVNYRDVAGYNPIVPAAIQGHPLSMMNKKRVEVKSKVIDIYVNCAVRCTTKEKEITDAGIKLLRYIDKIEKSGTRINLYACAIQNGDDNSAAALAVKIKDANRSIDIARLSFCLSHPAFLRVFCFDWLTRVGDIPYYWGYGHAIAQDANGEKLRGIYTTLFGKNAVNVEIENIIHNKNGGEDYIKKALADKFDGDVAATKR